jgi:UDP-3-O-[3-hydroxymyristoyl] glucosamine N-acyltransferase
MTPLTLEAVAAYVGASPQKPLPQTDVVAINTLGQARPDELSFFADARFRNDLLATKAPAVLASNGLNVAGYDGVVLHVPDAAAAADDLLDHFAPERARPTTLDPRAVVAESASLAPGVGVGPLVTIGERSRIGAGTVLHPGVVIGDDVVIGRDCELFANVVVRERCTLGDRVVIHGNAALGTDGFGYRFRDGAHRKITHVGTVVIEDDVEIGSCTTIDRGKFSVTFVGRGTKVDNLVQIAHNVRIGRHCIICANVGLAGSATIGDGVVLAGGSGVRDNITLGDGARLGAYSAAIGDLAAGKSYLGAPALLQRDFLREQAVMRKLPELARQLRRLQKQVDELTTDGA